MGRPDIVEIEFSAPAGSQGDPNEEDLELLVAQPNKEDQQGVEDDGSGK